MPLRPNGAIWLALLGACRLHGDVEVAKELLRKYLVLTLVIVLPMFYCLTYMPRLVDGM
jgi:hypothetical protein